uniref:EGF-like domain-containing protein n=1 Tax=Periophthalmus magnuspinnatus TaxID=409849 RepID=A0A3B4ALS8_9GOBI
MNTLVLTCLLSYVSSALGVWGSEVTFSTELSGVMGGPASGEGLHSSLNDDDELEPVDLDEDPSGEAHLPPHVLKHHNERKKKKGKGKRKNKHRGKSTTALNPEHMYHTSEYHTSGFTSAISTTEDPCTSTHLDYCIHGHCHYLEGLHEPVCICMKGYVGLRCGIQTLETKGPSEDEGSGPELIQTVLVVIAVVLSVISCIAIILMTCAQ